MIDFELGAVIWHRKLRVGASFKSQAGDYPYDIQEIKWDFKPEAFTMTPNIRILGGYQVILISNM